MIAVMKTLVPDYYESFACTAGKCAHNCCIGWEIDIDEDTERKYLSWSRNEISELSVKLSEKVHYTTRRERRNGAEASFILDEESGRCPFLNNDNLCEIIIEKGEDALCNICRDHPRFRNFYDDHIELGLGLTCEAAARLILTAENSTSYHWLNSDSAHRIAVPWHQKCIDNREIELIPEEEIDWTEWAEVFLSLERLSEDWTEVLDLIRANADVPCGDIYSNENLHRAFENLKEYLLFRHFMEYGRDFCELLWNLLIKAAAVEKKINGKFTIDDFVDLARIFSGEIEYSDENLGLILKELE